VNSDLTDGFVLNMPKPGQIFLEAAAVAVLHYICLPVSEYFLNLQSECFMLLHVEGRFLQGNRSCEAVIAIHSPPLVHSFEST
jgi:hypothetical protein